MKSFILRTIFWLNDFFHGAPVRKQYNSIRAGIQDKFVRRRALEELLSYASTHCAFYKEYAGCSLRQFPVIDKMVIKNNQTSFVVPEADNPWQEPERGYYIQKTSGSTGVPFAIPQDTRKRNRRLAELKYFGEVVGFVSHAPLVQLRIWTNWQNKSKWQSIKENIEPFDCSNLSEKRLYELVELIRKKRTVCVRGYASSFEIIGNFLKRNNLKLPCVRVMIAGSEALLESTRELIKETCPNCHMISQYANEEAGIMGQEEPGIVGKFNLNHAGYVFEVLKTDSDEQVAPGEVGRLVITDLYNYACPLIRYDTGDMCSYDIDERSGDMVITQLFGRRLDLVFNTAGEPIFPMYFARVLKNYDAIVQWQFVQKGEKSYALKLTLDSENKDFSEQWADIYSHLLQLLGADAELHVEYVEDIPVLKSGKRKSCVNEWRK